MSSKPNTLLMWSGGLDSTFMLWQAMVQGLPLRVHHVHMDNYQRRREAEAQAVERIRQWLEARGLANFQYSESHYGYGTLPYKVRDSYVWTFIAGTILARERNLTRLMMAWRRDEHRDYERMHRFARRLYTEIPFQVAGRRPQLVEPCAHLTREDCMREMPRDLLELCWWCRTPKAGQPCHACETCVVVDPLLAKLGVEFPVYPYPYAGGAG